MGSILPLSLRRGRRYCVSWSSFCLSLDGNSASGVLFAFLWQEQVFFLSHTHTFNYKYYLQVFDNRPRLLPVVSTGFKLSPGMPFTEQSMRSEEWLVVFLPGVGAILSSSTKEHFSDCLSWVSILTKCFFFLPISQNLTNPKLRNGATEWMLQKVLTVFHSIHQRVWKSSFISSSS